MDPPRTSLADGATAHGDPMIPTRAELMAADDIELLRHCRQELTRSSGPGGQHRNTTDSAVHLILLADPRIRVEAAEERSQHRNRHVALKRLRLAIALHWRETAAPAQTPTPVGPRNDAYPAFVAVVCDALERHQHLLAGAAAELGLSSGQLVRHLAEHDTLWGWVQKARQARGLHPLKHP